MEPFPPLQHASSAPTPEPLMHTPNSFPQLSPAQPLITRWNRRSRVMLHRLSLASMPSWRSPSKPPKPTFVKTYSARETLPVKIYIPPPRPQAPGRLPVYIHIAPTSFLVTKATPAAADHFCAHLAKAHGICVASVTFREPPKWLYPTQVYDVVAIIEEILCSPGLPIDRTRVALGGFGAGASVALSVVQTQEMRGMIKGVMAVGPVVDWTIAPKEKWESIERVRDVSPVETPAKKNRRRSNESEEQRSAQLSPKLYDLIYWSYVPPRYDLTESMLSPAFAPREAMPRHVFVVSAQHDMLCAETEKMALRFAADEDGDTVGDEEAWDCGGIKWEKILGWQHGFAFTPERGEREVERQRVATSLYDRIGDWLWTKPFAYA